MQRYVIYYRVSTKRQGESGLGLEAQKRDVQLYLDNYSGVPFEVVGEFTDIQSGKYADRPELTKALSLAERSGAELLVAKLDRISRKVSFISALLENPRVKLRVGAMPHADKFQLHIYAALAEQERDFISLRTKQALAVAKSRGVKLGGLRDATMKRNEGAKKTADAAAQRVASIIKPMRVNGSTLQQIAEALNAAKVQTPRGRQWTPMAVSNALKRLTEVECATA